MIAWMLRSLLATAAVAGAAVLVDALVRRLGLPRRPVWATTLALAAVLPAIARLLPATPPTPALSLPPGALNALLAGATSAAPSARPFPTTWLVGGAWALVSGALLAGLAYAVWRLRRLCAGWPTARVDDGEVVLSTGAGPLVVGLLRPRVVVPRWVVEAPEAERRMVLAHEREHVRAGDARLLAAAALLPALAPWNLPVWWLVLRLREAVETDCDRRVLAGGFAPEAYGRLLLSTAGGPRLGVLPAAALAEPKRLLERRLIAMTEKASDRRLRRLLPLALGAGALVVLACEVVRPDASAPASPVAPNASPANTAAPTLMGTSPRYLEYDTGMVRVAELARDFQITAMSVHNLAGGEAEVQVRTRDGKTRTFRVHTRRASALEPEPRGDTGFARTLLAEAARHVEARESPRAGGVVFAPKPTAEAPSQAVAITTDRMRTIESGPADQKVRANPLVFMDGVERTMTDLRALAPAHVESIEVLKGAAALREYGERGANGVIRVKTK